MFSAFDRTCVHFGVVACSAARAMANVRNSREEGGGTEGARREMGWIHTRQRLRGVPEPIQPLILMTGTSTKMELVFPEGDVS